MATDLDSGQAIRQAFNDSTQNLKVELSPTQLTIDAATDSIAIGDGTNKATITPVSTHKAIDVNVVQTVGGGGSGGDGAILDGTTPTVKATVRPGSSLTASTDTALVVTLREPVTVSGAAGGTAQPDKSSFVEGTTAMTPAGGVYNETIGSDPTEDQAAALRITAKRGLHVNLRDSSGVEISPATAANQSTANSSLSTIATNTTGIATSANQTSMNTKLDTLHTDLTTLDTDLKASQPRKLQDGSGTNITSTGGALDVNIKTPSTLPVSLSTLPALTAGSAVIGHVIVDAAPSTAVTNAGTFAVQASLNAETTKVIGTVNVASGQSITANVGTTNGLALDATLTGGTAKSVVRSAAKGTTTAADVTSANVDANTQALHTSVTNFPATQAVSGTVSVNALPTGTNTIGSVKVTDGTNTAAILSAAPVSDTGQSAMAVRVISSLAAGGSGSNAAAGTTGAAVPASASYTAFNSAGNLTGVSTANPLPVVQTGTLSTNATIQNASIAVTGPLTDTQLRATAVPVSLTSTTITNFPASQAVTNAGTFAVQAALNAETTKVIGTVNVAAAQSIAVTQATGTNLHAVLDTGSTTAVTQATAANLNATVVQSTPANLQVTATMAASQTIAVTQATASSLNATVAQGANTWTVQPGNTQNSTAWNVATIDTASGSTALGALNAAVSVALSGQVSAGFFLAAGTLIGTIIPEISFDGGTTYVATFFDNPITSQKLASIVFGSANTATSQSIVVAGGATHARVRVSAFTSGTANGTMRATQAGDPSVLFANPTNTAAPPTAVLVGGSDGTNIQSLSIKNASTPSTITDKALVVEQRPNQINTYSATTATVTIAATPTDIIVMPGSASKTIRVLRWEINTTQTTAGINTWFLIKRSAANTGGTTAALLITPHDTNNVAVTAAPVAYSVNPTTPGAAVGTAIRKTQILAPALTSLVPSASYVWNFCENGAQGIVLRGVAQLLALNFNAAAVPAGLTLSSTITWTEE